MRRALMILPFSPAADSYFAEERSAAGHFFTAVLVDELSVKLWTEDPLALPVVRQ